MNSRIAAVLGVSLLLATWDGLQAQSAQRNEATLRAVDDRERIAALKRDVPALERLWAAELTVNAPTNKVLAGRDAVMALVHGGVINFSRFDRTIEFIRIDGDLGIIMGRETIRPVGNAPGAGRTLQRRFTNIWKREGDTWRLYIRHANLLPGAPT
ncbi:MAG TPA: nuclear transport factor 2 family protein [Gemmatimonadales bacterium]